MGQAPAPVAAPRTLLQVTPSPQRGTQTQESPPPPALHCIFLTPGHDARRAPVNNSCLAGASSASPRGPYSPGAGYFPPLRPGSAACKHSTRGDQPRRSQGPRAPGTPVRTTKSCLAAGKSLVNPQGSWESPDFTVVLVLAVAKHTALTLTRCHPHAGGTLQTLPPHRYGPRDSGEPRTVSAQAAPAALAQATGVGTVPRQDGDAMVPLPHAWGIPAHPAVPYTQGTPVPTSLPWGMLPLHTGSSWSAPLHAEDPGPISPHPGHRCLSPDIT